MMIAHAAVRQAARLALAALLLIAACRTASTAPEAAAITLDVAPTRAPCVGEGQKQCLQIRLRAADPWQLFYGEIEGFQHDSGFEYTLRVEVRPVPSPPADGSDRRYRLLEIVRKVAS